MSGTTMIVLIVLIVGMVKVLSKGRGGGNREQMLDWMRGQPGPDAAENRQLRDDVRQLKERIAVLERVVTDNHGSTDLDREIERLRDR